MTAVGPGVALGVLVLALGTYGFRVSGPLLSTRITLSPKASRIMAVAAVVMLTALAVNSALLDGRAVADWSRPAGVAVGAVLAWRRAPLVLVVLAAAGTAALLRL
ncbi:AzlD domain-containing protein [Speluncibacter jeojiensis]|uniref:AzlD domain-containing protein n=1 Tax=Speluncibacter jeojiensis TaxID=2710754 RepID=UPI00240F6231|nr:AzlD domain-containing protein [Rhodococcus sp. D2-41]